jgi:hypothetical protein
VAIVRVAGQCGHLRDELAAGGMFDGSGDAHLDAELAGPMRLAFADAFDLGRMERIDLAPALMAVLGQHATGQAQLAGKNLFQGVFSPAMRRPMARMTRPR